MVIVSATGSTRLTMHLHRVDVLLDSSIAQEYLCIKLH